MRVAGRLRLDCDDVSDVEAPRVEGGYAERRGAAVGPVLIRQRVAVAPIAERELALLRRGAGWGVQHIANEERRVHFAARVLDRAIPKWRLADVHHREAEPRLPAHPVVAYRAVEDPRRDLPEVGASCAEASWLGEIAVRVLEMECGVRLLQRLGRGAGRSTSSRVSSSVSVPASARPRPDGSRGRARTEWLLDVSNIFH